MRNILCFQLIQSTKEMITIKLFEFLNKTVNMNISIEQWAIMESGQNIYDEFKLSKYKIEESKFISDVVRLFSIFQDRLKDVAIELDYEDYLDNNLSIFHFVADYFNSQTPTEISSIIFTSQHVYLKYYLSTFKISFKEFVTFLFFNYIVAMYQLEEEQDWDNPNVEHRTNFIKQ